MCKIMHDMEKEDGEDVFAALSYNSRMLENDWQI